MKPKQEAEKLVNDMCLPHLSFIDAKKCALVCVDRIIHAINDMGHGEAWGLKEMIKKVDFWVKVKEQIEKL